MQPRSASTYLDKTPPLERGRPLGRGSRAAFVLTAAALLASVALGPRDARGDEPVDTVVLQSGTKLRGTVMVDDNATVSIKLLDGTSRSIKRAEVARIEYADAPKAPAADPPADRPAEPKAVAEPEEEPVVAPRPRRRGPVRPTEDEEPLDAERSRKTGVPGLWITGISVFGASYLTAIVLTATLTPDQDRAKAIGYSCIPLFGGPASFAEDDFDIRSPYAEAIVVDTVLQHIGAAMFIIGLSVPGRSSSDIALGTSGSSLVLTGSF